MGRRGNDPDPATIRIREFYRAWRSVELPCFRALLRDVSSLLSTHFAEEYVEQFIL
ncbi:MAG: hypothetical protein ACO390_12020 [bacterium]